MAGAFLRLESFGFADLFFKMGVEGFWGWLPQIHGRIDLDVAVLFIKLGWILVAFLSITLVAESIVVARVRSKINVFAEQILKTL